MVVISREILKSIINEFSNYKFWQKQKIELYKSLELLNQNLYEVTGISYDKIPRQAYDNTYEKYLLEYVEKKDFLLSFIECINLKEEFVKEMLLLMNDEDRLFITRVLINRSIYETNGSIAIRKEITESGVRYKINTIIKRTFNNYIGSKT